MPADVCVSKVEQLSIMKDTVFLLPLKALFNTYPLPGSCIAQDVSAYRQKDVELLHFADTRRQCYPSVEFSTLGYVVF